MCFPGDRKERANHIITTKCLKISSVMCLKNLKINRIVHPAISLIGMNPKKRIEQVHCKNVGNSKKLETTRVQQ